MVKKKRNGGKVINSIFSTNKTNRYQKKKQYKLKYQMNLYYLQL